MSALAIYTVCGHDIETKEVNGQRVISLKEIDDVHERPEGTARRNFNQNRTHFEENEDFYVLSPLEAKHMFGITAPNGLILLSESGYMLLVKSFTDDLAWQVQKQLVKGYFKAKELVGAMTELSPQLQFLIKLELDQKKLREDVDNAVKQISDMKTIMTLDPRDDWREKTRKIINRVCANVNDFEKPWQYVYDITQVKAGCNLELRLKNLKERAKSEGKGKTFVNQLNMLDVISMDKKLITIFIQVVKEFAIQQGVDVEGI